MCSFRIHSSPLELAQASGAARIGCIVVRQQPKAPSAESHSTIKMQCHTECRRFAVGSEQEVHPPRELTGAFDIGHDAPKGRQPLAHPRGCHHCLDIWQLGPLHQVGQYIPHDLQPDTVQRSGSCRDSALRALTEPGNPPPPGLVHVFAGAKLMSFTRRHIEHESAGQTCA